MQESTDIARVDASPPIPPPEPPVPVPPAAPAALSTDKIWEELGHDLEKGIGDFAEKYSLAQDLVTAAAIVEAQNRSNFHGLFLEERSGVPTLVYKESYRKFFTSLATRKLQMLLSICMFILLLMGVGMIAARLISPERQIVVQRKDGLPGYHKIAADETEVKALEAFHKTHDADNFEGRYTLVPLPADSVISERSLLSPQLTERMAGRRIVPIPVKGDRSPSSLRANTSISLAFIKDGKSKILSDLILIGIEKHDAALTLITALSAEQFDEVQGSLIGSEIFVVGPVSE